MRTPADPIRHWAEGHAKSHHDPARLPNWVGTSTEPLKRTLGEAQPRTRGDNHKPQKRPRRAAMIGAATTPSRRESSDARSADRSRPRRSGSSAGDQCPPRADRACDQELPGFESGTWLTGGADCKGLGLSLTLWDTEDNP